MEKLVEPLKAAGHIMAVRATGGPQTSAGAEKSKESPIAHAELQQRAVALCSYLIAQVFSTFSAFSCAAMNSPGTALS